jgi:CRISPR/Cas system endoribonuclease Cas6 (RAMP superfamily)
VTESHTISAIFISELIENSTIDYPEARRYSSLADDPSHFLYQCSPKAYRFLKQFIPLPSVSCLFLNFTSIAQNAERLFIDSLGIPSFVSEWRHINEIESEPLEAFLAVDVAYVQSDACIPYVEGRPCNNAH